jgi:hypothetical protein
MDKEETSGTDATSNYICHAHQTVQTGKIKHGDKHNCEAGTLTPIHTTNKTCTVTGFIISVCMSFDELYKTPARMRRLIQFLKFYGKIWQVTHICIHETL